MERGPRAAHRSPQVVGRRTAADRGSLLRILTAAAIAIAAAGGAARAEGGQRPWYEIAASGGTDGRGAAARVELDAAIPIGARSPRNRALFPPARGRCSRGGPHGRALHGGTLGIVYRFEGAGGIVGLNAFHDVNRLTGPGRRRTHRQASLGADYQRGGSRIGASWYIPLSGRRGRDAGLARIEEYAVGGPELRYRFAPDERWTVRGRAFHEVDRGGRRAGGRGSGRGWRLSAGAGYRIGCTRLGLDVERDTARGETALHLGLTVRFGAPAVRCAGAAKPHLLALVEREKIVATRHIAARRLVPLTALPDDVTDLYEPVPGGAADADTVWLFSQGGPVPELDALDLTEFPGHESRILANVHQVQTLNPALIEDTRLDSVERVRVEMDVSVEILDRVIRHFRSRGKKVVVFSHSFGSFIVPRYLALKGPGAADRYVIMAGRLDIEREVWENRLGKLREGGTVTYAYGDDGATLVRIDVADLPPGELGSTLENGMLPRSVRLASAFQGVLGMHRYTRLLARTDLSKVVYAYGTMDRAVGRLTADEVTFLESRGAEVIAVAGGHGSMFDDPGTTRRIVDLLGE